MSATFSKIISLILTAVFSILGASIGITDTHTPSRAVDILFTNDVHCAVDKKIGYAGLAAYKAELEKGGKTALLVDCGDAVQGDSLGSLSKGKSIIEIMNKVGYDVMTPGNHEFDYGMDGFFELMKLADFSTVSANFCSLPSGKNVLMPYVIKKCNGVKIAFVGVSTPKTLTSSTPAYFMDDNGNFIYGFCGGGDGTAFYEKIQSAVDSAKKDGADYVVAISHLGIDSGCSPYMSTELIENTNGIDAVLDGHSHSTVPCERVLNKDGEKVLLSSTGTGLAAIGRLIIKPDGTLTSTLVTTYTEKDEAVKATVDELKAKNTELLNTVVAESQEKLTVTDPVTGVRIIRNAETNLGDFCADAYRASCGADIAIVNGGGIRAEINSGSVTYGDIISVFPYGNMLCEVEVTGQELLDVLEHSVRALPSESGGFLQVSGMSFSIKPGASSVTLDDNGMFSGVGSFRKITDVKVGGEALDLSKTYTLVSHNYLIKNCGDGYTMFKDNTLLLDDFITDYDALINYFKNVPADADYSNAYGEGRIIAAD